MTCYIKTIYGILRTEQTVIWFWISCWEDASFVIDPRHEPDALPLAA